MGFLVGVVLTLVVLFAIKKKKDTKVVLDPKQFTPGPEKRHNIPEV